TGEELAGFVDDHFGGEFGNNDAAGDEIAVDGDELAFGVGVERAGTRIQRFAIRTLDLEPAIAGQRHIKAIAGAVQRTLDVNVANCAGLDAEADMPAFGYVCLVGAVGHALGPLDLIEKIGEFGAGALETG